MLVALVQDDTVQSVQNLTDDQISAIGNQYEAIIDVSDPTVYPTTPVAGWVFNGVTLVPPGGSPATWRITKLAMLQRFTLTERLGILTYIGSNPVSVPAVLLQNIQVATFVDLTRADTVTGINYLVSLGLITSARATAILTTPPTDLEVYVP